MMYVDDVTDVKLLVQDVVVAAVVLRQSEGLLAGPSEELLAGPLAPPAERQPNISYQQQEASTYEPAAAIPAPTLPIFCSSVRSSTHAPPPPHPLMQSSYYSCTYPSIHLLVHSFIHSPPPTHPCNHSFTHLPIHPSMHPCIHPSIHAFIHSVFHSFSLSFIHSFIHSFIPLKGDCWFWTDLCRWPPPHLTPNQPLPTLVY